MSPCSTKPRFAIGLSKGLSWQGRRLALSRCIPLAAASLHKPNHFFARQTARQRRLCLRSNRGGLFVRQCTVWPLHHQSGEPPSYPINDIRLSPMVREISLSPEPHRPRASGTKGRSCPLEPRPFHGDQAGFRAPLETHDQP
jgi:hypothetical protein